MCNARQDCDSSGKDAEQIGDDYLDGFASPTGVHCTGIGCAAELGDENAWFNCRPGRLAGRQRWTGRVCAQILQVGSGECPAASCCRPAVRAGGGVVSAIKGGIDAGDVVSSGAAELQPSAGRPDLKLEGSGGWRGGGRGRRGGRRTRRGRVGRRGDRRRWWQRGRRVGERGGRGKLGR